MDGEERENFFPFFSTFIQAIQSGEGDGDERGRGEETEGAVCVCVCVCVWRE